MKFRCDFKNPDTGEEKSIIVTLNSAQVESVEAIRAHADDYLLFGMAYALQNAHRELPDGFRHVRPPEPVTIQ